MIGKEIREATEELSFERKRYFLERLLIVITLDPSSIDRRRKIGEHVERDILIEVLGYATSVRLKRQTPMKRPSQRLPGSG